MQLPETLRAAIEERAESVPLPELSAAVDRLIDGYRHPARVGARPFLDSHAIRLAYLAVRMPATFAALRAVLEDAALRLPGWRPESMLDLMSGPGTGAWAACETYPGMARAMLIDRDGDLVSLGTELRRTSGHAALREASVRVEALRPSEGFPEVDLVSLAYGLCELSPRMQSETIAAAWSATRGALVLVEPGTPEGFAAILAARDALLASGAQIAVPCPHHEACPMPAGEWCHFVQRLPRSRLHRLAKGGALGFEDEKYCCLVAAREGVVAPQARVVEPPRAHKAAVDLRVCTSRGAIERTSVPRREKAAYKAARKLAWGDGVNLEGGDSEANA